VTIQVENGTTIILPEPKREGYAFDYWEGSRYNAGAPYTVNGDHTFKAQWKKGGSAPVPTKPSAPDNTPSHSKTPTTPRTGDGAHPLLWGSLLALSLTGLLGLAVTAKRRRK
jgi:hypothetical protein